MRFISALLLCVISCMPSFGLDKTTEIYDVAGSDTLRLDFYRAASPEPAPVMIFAFGGGFKGGERDNSSYIPMFEYMTRNGVAVVSVDYRTLLKDIPAQEMMTPDKFKANLISAIDAATTDFLKATGYVVSKSSEWNINPSQIFACGSSAGAITVLQAEYSLCNDKIYYAGLGLPDDFNYAGVISMAGAICSDGAPQWDTTPCPMLLFHGDADSIVPFVSATLGDFGLWGSRTISDILTEQQHPHRFHCFNGASHEIAGTPMDENRGEILDFIRAACSTGLNRTTKTTEEIPGNTDYKKDFTIIDYIKANL